MSKDVTITIKDQEGTLKKIEVPTDMGFSLMEILKANEYETVKAICGGMAICATCHVYIDSEHALGEPSDEEEDMLDTLPNVEDNSRLSCQLKINSDYDGLCITLADHEENNS